MAGHSHWAGIKHKKAATDAKRGKVFSKIARRITIAAKAGGGDPDSNLELRYAMDDARSSNMPKVNVERAVKKGLGNLPGTNYESIIYEGYGSGGVAVMAEALTDNRNRTAGEIRKIFDRNSGRLGVAGCVAWMFERKGVVIVDGEGVDEDELMMAVLEAGADDMLSGGEIFEVTCAPTDVRSVKRALEEAGFSVRSASAENIPKSEVNLDAKDGRKILRLLEKLDDHDDIESVSANFNVPDEVMAEIAAE